MKISVITPTFNRGTMLQDAIESVLVQNWDDFEHLIIDGGSTDGTLALLQQYPHLKIISEPDSGLYDAINKGIKLATGELICHLNSDDRLTPDTFSKIVSVFKNNPDLESVAGGVDVFTRDENGNEQIIRHINAMAIKELRLGDVTHGVPNINGRFFHRSLYERIGDYDLRFPIAADREFLMRALLQNMRRSTVKEIVYRYRHHDDSLTLQSGSMTAALQDNIWAAKTGMKENTANSTAYSSYRKWHAWSALYLIADHLRSNRLRDATKFLVRTLGTDPLWPLIAIPELKDHWTTRKERRWSNC